MQTLATALRTFKKRHDIANNRHLALMIGVALPTIYSALAGGRIPNSRTVRKYATALKTTPERVMTLARAGAASSTAKISRRTKGPKVIAVMTRRFPTPGRGQA